MLSLCREPGLLMMCLPGPKEVVALSAAAKLFHEVINPPGESYKDKYFSLRKACDVKREVFPAEIAFGDALVDDEGVEVFSIGEKVYRFRLMDEIKPIEMLIEVTSANFALQPPSVARLGGVIKISSGDVSQLVVQEGQLYSVSKRDDSFMTVTTNNNYVTLGYLRSDIICFGPKYLIYNDKYSVAVVRPLEYLETKMSDKMRIFDPSCFFPRGNDFLQVIFRKDLVCDLLKVSIKEGTLKRTKIAEKLKIFEGKRKAICLHENRLIMAFETDKETRMWVYDLVVDEVHEWPSSAISDCETFEPRFLCLNDRIYYLFAEALKYHLTTYKIF